LRLAELVGREPLRHHRGHDFGHEYLREHGPPP
jgi:hypothetical protein